MSDSGNEVVVLMSKVVSEWQYWTPRERQDALDEALYRMATYFEQEQANVAVPPARGGHRGGDL